MRISSGTVPSTSAQIMPITVCEPCPISGMPVNKVTIPSSAILTIAAEVSLSAPLEPEACAPIPIPMPWYFGSFPYFSFQPDRSVAFSMHSFKPQLANSLPSIATWPCSTAFFKWKSTGSIPRDSATLFRCCIQPALIRPKMPPWCEPLGTVFVKMKRPLYRAASIRYSQFI